MIRKIEAPDFANEAEELDWWFANREEHGEVKAMGAGRTMTMQQLLAHGLTGPRIAVELDFDDVVEAMRQ